MDIKLKKSKFKVALFLLTLTGFVGAFISYGRYWGGTRMDIRPTPVAHPTIGPLRDVIVSKGTVSYDHQLVMRSALSGRVAAMALKEGSEVKQGQTLLQVQDLQEGSDLELRKVDQHRIEAKISSLNKDVEVLRRLVEIGSSPRYDLEQKILERDLTMKDLDRARIEIARLGERRAMTYLKSPINGLVITVPVVQGQTVSAGDEMLTLAGGSGRVVVAYIDATDIERIQVGQAVVFSDQEDGGKRRKGRVKEVARMVATAQRQNAVKVIVEPQEPITDLRISQQLYVEFVVFEDASALRIPRELIYTRDDKKFVNVLTKDGVRAKPIQTTHGDATFEKVISGVSVDDQLLRKGVVGGNAP